METYKYDELAVRMAGVDVDTLNKADGEHDVNVETALAKYSLQDVQFTYLNIDDIITDTDAAAADADVFVEVVYSVENDLMKILGLQVKNAKKTGITAKRRLDYIWL